MNVDLSYKKLVNDINEQISEAWNSVRSLESLFHNYSAQSDLWNDEHEFEDAVFKSQIERIYVSLCLLFEAIGYVKILEDFKSGFQKFIGKETNLRVLSYVGEHHSDVLGYFWTYHRTVSALFDIDTKESDDLPLRTRFESILQNTAKIVFDRDVKPDSEAQVRKCVYDVLIHVFPDTVREIPIAQVTKTYKPDIGIRSLKAAAEYKYAVTEEEAKKVIGGFYEDMKGYAGSEDWKYFYAVVYMTKPFFTLQQIQAEFAHVGVQKNWMPILVYGDGTRRAPKVSGSSPSTTSVSGST